MIGKQEILERALEWQLRPDVVEKDYVLGWVLAAIAQHPETSEHWVFKGGTCLKKCYFETYRFSEDLDFTLLPDAAYDVVTLTQTLQEVVEIAHELGGITFPADVVSVRTRIDKLGRETFEGKIGYRGPLDIPTTPRLLFDLTRHEPVLAEPELRPVFHAYPDSLPNDTAVQAYSLTASRNSSLRRHGPFWNERGHGTSTMSSSSSRATLVTWTSPKLVNSSVESVRRRGSKPLRQPSSWASSDLPLNFGPSGRTCSPTSCRSCRPSRATSHASQTFSGGWMLQSPLQALPSQLWRG